MAPIFEACELIDIQRAKPLELAVVWAPGAPVFYIEIDGTGVPVVKAETEGRTGKSRASRHSRVKSSLAACSPRPRPTQKTTPCLTRIPHPASARLNRPSSSAYVFTPRSGGVAGTGP